MKIFHHDDADGICSAAIAWQALGCNEDIECIQVSYKDPFPIKKVSAAEKIWILDYGMPVEELEELLKVTTDIVWIDHHATSLGLHPEIPGIRSKDKAACEAACELTWEWFHRDVPVPMAVRYIGDRDTWTWKYGDDTKFFYNAYQMLADMRPASPAWGAMFNNTTGVVEEMKNSGAVIERYKMAQNEKIVNAWAYETEFEGIRALALDAPNCIDRLSNTMLNRGYPIAILYTHSGNNFQVSMYTQDPNIDVSRFAKKYGGGGHKQAAGFICPKIPFARKDAVTH